MNDSLTKFQQLLRELFQFDCADLDFGIYRIMNYKRDVIEDFITRDLPQTINDELAHGCWRRFPNRWIKSILPGLAALIAERRKTAAGEPVSALEHHLRKEDSKPFNWHDQ